MANQMEYLEDILGGAIGKEPVSYDAEDLQHSRFEGYFDAQRDVFFALEEGLENRRAIALVGLALSGLCVAFNAYRLLSPQEVSESMWNVIALLMFAFGALCCASIAIFVTLYLRKVGKATRAVHYNQPNAHNFLK